MLDDYLRLELVRLATEDYPKIKPCAIEFKLPQPNYTVNTLAHLQEDHPNHEFALIMGEDNLDSLPKWKNHDVIIQNHAVYVYPRMSHTLKKVPSMDLKSHPSIHFVEAPILEISATFIRESIKNKKNIRPLVPEKVWTYIDHNNLYKK